MDAANAAVPIEYRLIHHQSLGETFTECFPKSFIEPERRDEMNTTQLTRPGSPTRVKVEDPSLLISKAELAEHFRCSERQIDKLTAEGKIPKPIMLGNTRRWPRSTIIAWLDKLTGTDGKRETPPNI